MVTVLYFAVLVAVDGFISLITDREVITQADAGPLVGIAMSSVALLIMFASLLGGLKPMPGRRKLPVGRAISTALLIYLVAPAAGAVVYSFGQPQLASAIPFFLGYLLSSFVVAAAAIAVVPVLLIPWIDRVRSGAR